MPILLQICMLCFFSFPLIAQDENANSDVAFEMAQQFSKCAGLFDAMAEFSTRESAKQGKSEEGKAIAEQAHGTANGAAVAAQYIASQVVKSEQAVEFVENLRAIYRNEWLIHTFDGLDAEFQQEMAVCQALNPLQVEIIQGLRKKAYGFEK